MKGFLLGLVLSLNIEIPDSLLFTFPRSLFPERKGLEIESIPKVMELRVSPYYLGVNLGSFGFSASQLPMKGIKVSWGEYFFTTRFKDLSFYTKGYWKNFGTLLTLQDTFGVYYTGDKIFGVLEFYNFTDYVPGDRPNPHFHTFGYLTVGGKVGGLAPFITLGRLNKGEELGWGFGFFHPLLTTGLHFKGKEFNAISFIFKYQDFSFNFIFDHTYTYGFLTSFDYIRVRPGEKLRVLSPFEVLSVEIKLLPFAFSFMERQWSEAYIPEVGEYTIHLKGGVRERIYKFEVLSEFLNMAFAHFESPVTYYQDTVGVSWRISEKYYDIGFYYSYRRHTSSVQFFGLDIDFKLFKDLNPFFRVHNIFNASGEFLPGINLKRRYVEVGGLFRKEI